MSEPAERIKEIQEALNELEMKRNSIQSELNEIRTKIQSGDISESTERNLKDEQEHLNQELDSVIEEISLLEDELAEFVGADNTLKDYQNISELSSDLLNRLDSEYDRFQDNREQLEMEIKDIEEQKDQLDDLEETARGLISRTTSASLGEQFAGRKEELQNSLIWWKIGSIVSIVLLLLSSAIVYINIISSDNNYILNFSKVALLLPVSVAVWFTVSNYSRQKRLMEEYEFKARMALSLEGFLGVLEERLNVDSEEEKLEFFLNTVENIYSNPQKNIRNDANSDDVSPVSNGNPSTVELLKKIGNR
ncbi:hypothetical protein SVXHr_2480 [Halorhabdus sp. SVX81]|uniref:hypothetical protein n=1 Tax=Halorhabdus sp. SVX81 TaxID=2978283 RepID=UPI0023DBE6B6|nr:hypothetical protein [Halorhabdus sp. SVX81]WEL18628.1 hypothetical protein SVXHr_2480 [Halorhabdus sp. SVX81]